MWQVLSLATTALLDCARGAALCATCWALWRAGVGFGAGVAALYGALYALLQMEQTALVMGSVLLFVVLAAVMLLTRRLDWYSLLRAPATPVAAE